MTAEKKNPYDKTSSKRAASHLERMVEAKGKRVPIDFDAERLEKMDTLIQAGYGESKAAVVRKAIDDVYKKLIKKA